MIMSASNFNICFFLALKFDILAVYGPIGLCFGYDAPVGLCYHVFKAHGPITGFRGPWGLYYNPV